MNAIRLPMKTVNPNNGAQGRSFAASMAKSRRRKAQRGATRMALERPGAPLRAWLELGGTVEAVITRIAPSAGLDPHDGLPAALKSVVDGLADALRLKSDRDPRLRLEYRQARGKVREYAVTVEFRAVPAQCGSLVEAAK